MPWPAYWKPHLWMTRRDAGLMTRVETCSTEMPVDRKARSTSACAASVAIAASPVGLADPVAELQPAVLGVEAGAADERAGAGKRQRIGDAGLPQLAHGEEGARLGLAIGVRHARQHLRDMAVVGELHESCDIALARRAHHQPLA